MSVAPLDDAPQPVLNGLAGNPSDGAAHYFAIEVTVAGTQDPQSQYLLSIQDIDASVRQQAWPLLRDLLRQPSFSPAKALQRLAPGLAQRWPGARLTRLRLRCSPQLYFTLHSGESPMIRICQRFEFSAAHRLHNPSLSDAGNAALFGKCNNPEGHGHNYELEVELRGPVNPDGRIIALAEFERIVHEAVLERFDHKHLNRQTAEFAMQIPSVENIARTIHGLLASRFASPIEVARVTVWETPKTSATFSV